jgi:hypothetical protein
MGLFGICFLLPFYLATQRGFALLKRKNGEKRENGKNGREEGVRKKGDPRFLFSHSSHSPSSPRSRATKVQSHAALSDKTAKENRSRRAP